MDRSRLSILDLDRALGARSGVRVVPLFTRMLLVECSKRFIYDRHQHRNYEVILVERGDYRCDLNGTWLTLGPGGVLVIKPGDWHQDDCERGLRYYGFGFNFDRRLLANDPPPLFDPGVAPGGQCLEGGAQTAALLKQLRRESEQGDWVYPQLKEALLLELFWRIVRGLPERSISERFRALLLDQGFSTRLTRLFQEHVARPLSVAEMAREFHISPRSLAARCRRLLGCSPARALMQCRLEHARTLLGQLRLSVKEVAQQLGFADPFHFSKAFKRHFGTSPSRCRAGAGLQD